MFSKLCLNLALAAKARTLRGRLLSVISQASQESRELLLGALLTDVRPDLNNSNRNEISEFDFLNDIKLLGNKKADEFTKWATCLNYYQGTYLEAIARRFATAFNIIVLPSKAQHKVYKRWAENLNGREVEKTLLGCENI